jgi:capsular exopolysaccharide synthesis family protein
VDLPSPAEGWKYPTHAYLISGRLADQVAVELGKDWAGVLPPGAEKRLTVSTRYWRRMSSIEIIVRGPYPKYNEAFIEMIVELHRKEWEMGKNARVDSAAAILVNEMLTLEDNIRRSEDELFEYQRLHRIPYVQTRGGLEEAYLRGLAAREHQLETELYMLEALNPILADADEDVLRHLNDLTAQTGSIRPEGLPTDLELPGDALVEDEAGTLRGGMTAGVLQRHIGLDIDNPIANEPRVGSGKKVALYMLKKKEEELAARLTAQHPSVVRVRADIKQIEDEFGVMARIELARLQARKKAIGIHLKIVQDSQYQWQGKFYRAGRRRAHLKRLGSAVKRYEGSYMTLFNRVHQLKVAEEMNSETYQVINPPSTTDAPVWPDPFKVLLIALVAGLGSGFGMAIISQLLDNKMQSIRDVESVLGVPFLGGVPYWVHSDLERTIRPIVTEEFSAGAVEAYRAIRTSVTAAADELGENIIIVSSADSKEGKTLTVLNLAIMIAQAGKKTLLLDMDLRRGRMHRSIGLEKSPGVTEALKEAVSLKEVIVPTRFENLSFAPCGESHEHIAENLYSSDLPGLFAELREEYDYILVDTAPVLRVTDTVILATQDFGVVVYVAHVNRTPKALIRYSLDLLANANVIGMIMNSIEMHKISGLYYSYQYPNYAYYSNAYAYGYDYGYYYHDQTGTGSGSATAPRLRGVRARRARNKRGLKQWFGRMFSSGE